MEQLEIQSFLSQKEILRDLRNYLAGQAEDFSRDEALLEEVLKCTFSHHYLSTQQPLEKDIDKNIRLLAIRYREAFTEVCQHAAQLFPDGTQILLGPENIAYIHHALENIRHLKDNEDDLVGDIYEVFIGTSYRGQEGQYFTPATAVKALITFTEPDANALLIDPACGAGSFLVESCKFMGTALDSRNICGIDKDTYLARLSRLRLSLQFDQDFNVVSADSLTWNSQDFTATSVAQNFGKYDLCLTNPPFGKKIVALTDEYKRKFELAYQWKFSKKDKRFTKTAAIAPNTPPQVLFIERCLSLLKPGGLLGMVIPESVLSNTVYRHVVHYILTHATPLAVVGMPDALFKTSGKGGTHTKVCLLVLKKAEPGAEHTIFMAEAKWCGHDSRGKKIPYNDIPGIVQKYQTFITTGQTNGDRFGFQVKLNDVKDFVLAPRYYNPEPAQELAQLTKTHLVVSIAELLNRKILAIATGDELGKLAYGTGEIPFVRTSDISNWEIKSDPKHFVAETYYNALKSKQDVQEGDILMVRDGTYLIGTCAMITKYDTKIVYQSHIYKIRIYPNDLFDNYLFLAILSSKPVQSQIRSLSFTLDIIDSLGDRLKDILLPIPQNEQVKQDISGMVKKSISERIEARELAKKARELVVIG